MGPTSSSSTSWGVVYQLIVHHFLVDQLLPLIYCVLPVIHTVIIGSRCRLRRQTENLTTTHNHKF